VQRLCEILGISKSAYYEKLSLYGKMQESKAEEMKIFKERSKILFDVWCEEGFETFGYQKMSRELLSQNFSWAHEKKVRT